MNIELIEAALSGYKTLYIECIQPNSDPENRERATRLIDYGITCILDYLHKNERIDPDGFSLGNIDAIEGESFQLEGGVDTIDIEGKLSYSVYFDGNTRSYRGEEGLIRRILNTEPAELDLEAPRVFPEPERKFEIISLDLLPQGMSPDAIARRLVYDIDGSFTLDYAGIARDNSGYFELETMGDNPLANNHEYWCMLELPELGYNIFVLAGRPD